MRHSFFSVSFSLVTTDRPIPYDLYINSSSVEDREHFIKIWKQGDHLNSEDLHSFKSKYHQIYVSEGQRGVFLKSFCNLKGAKDEEKTTVLKASAIEHLETLFDHEKELTTEVLSQTIQGCRDAVEGMIDVLQDYTIDKLRDLIANLSFHDFYTYDHSINVSMYCILLYRSMYPDASRSEILQAGMGGLLHDLGKIKIPTQIINNAGKLSDEDFAVIKMHPMFGCELLAQSGVQLPSGISGKILNRVILEHHENYDGSGYPKQIKGESIHLLARITAIADFFDAVTTKRSYHDPLSPEDAIALMSRSEGKKLDPKVFRIFVQHTRHLDLKPATLQLPKNFDPCQPHQTLPFEKVGDAPEAQSPLKDEGDFGSIRVVASLAEKKQAERPGFGKIKMVTERPKKKTG